MYVAKPSLMHEFTALFEEATRRLPEAYFQIAIDGGDPVYRERVYCYELYHQLRCLWPAETEFYLNGELDKAAHPIVSQLGVGQAKPDLLVHRPGYMSGNHAIMEVKSIVGAHNEAILQDFRKLSLFRSKVGYERAIYLLFGYDPEAACERVKRVAEPLNDPAPIEFWVHARPGESATCVAIFP